MKLTLQFFVSKLLTSHDFKVLAVVVENVHMFIEFRTVKKLCQ